MRTTHTALLGTLAAVGMLLAGCGGGPDSETHPTASAPPSEPTLANFDPCTALTPTELDQVGIEDSGERVDNEYGSSGCDFPAENFLFTIYKNSGEDMSTWDSRRNNFAEYERNRVGDRAGRSAVVNGAQGQGLCRQIMAAAQGSVSVVVKYDADQIQGNDPCTKAKEIAETIEPRLPEPQN
ncbi:DUF3558 domain-containing protein [Actinopolyspora mortivallis]|uniref:DUF3558 domain-containing protein n=1 Tax=Actinopolyspora mortivallis TaxID=33906 RepID=UPI001B7FB42F|nr:DUF3558 domain-containing protein [Actinopolyspora mortivallis]